MSYPIVASREGVYAYMQMLMEREDRYKDMPFHLKSNFALLRSHAEELTRFHFIKDGVTEITREQIYDALAMTGEMTAEDAAELMSMEEETLDQLWGDGFGCEDEKACILSWLNGLEEDFSAQLLAGAAKKAVIGKSLQGPSRIGAIYGGPILMPYVEWFLRQSEARGFRRLYFIARDGYILKIMADALIYKLKLNIGTHYIHGSRRAWRTPSYLGKEGELQGLVGWSYTQHIRTTEDLAEVLYMPVEELRPHMLAEYAEKNYILKQDDLAACVIHLDKSADFRKKLREILTEKRSLVIEYLQQEIDTSDDHFAFVELGGGGFTQICLSRLMHDFYSGGTRTFFYKMDRVRRSDSDCIFYNFFPSKLKNDLVVEMVCRAPEGQTEGYERQGDRVVTLKKQGEKELYLAHGYGDYMKGVEAFTEAYVEPARKFRPEPSLKASLACMNALAEQGDNEVTEFFGGLPNRVTGREDDAPDFAPQLTKQQVQDIFVRYADGTSGAHYQGTDFEMSLKRSNPFIQAKVAKYRKHHWEIRNRWLNLFPQVVEDNHLGGVAVRKLPYSMLGKRVVLYGAGVRGKRWYKELSNDKALAIVQWLDKEYLQLKDELPVTGDMESLGQVEFDWLMVDFANAKIMESVIEELQQHGVVKEKIYTPQRIAEWIAGWINYLHV